MTLAKKLGAIALGVALLGTASVAGAAYNERVKTKGAGSGAAVMNCPGGMTRLGHPFEEFMTVFEGDPSIDINLEYTVAQDFFLVEDIDMGAHAGTHLDVPVHFIEGGRSVDQLSAEEFVWPVYKMDVRGMTFENGLIEKKDIRDYEKDHGKIPKTGALVILQTGAQPFWGAESLGTTPGKDDDPNAANIDDFFDFLNPGFSGDAVQWLFDKRNIDGVGSDAYGPDAYSDGDFNATFTTLANDGVALVALDNLDSVNVRGDIIVASTVALENGSGFPTDPLACHGEPYYYGDDDWDDGWNGEDPDEGIDDDEDDD